MKFKLLIIDALFIINLILGTYVIGKEVHNTFFAPTHDVTTHYTVKAVSYTHLTLPTTSRV